MIFPKRRATSRQRSFSIRPVGADGAGVVAAVTGIDDDAANFQTQRAGERGLAVVGGGRGAGRSG